MGVRKSIYRTDVSAFNGQFVPHTHTHSRTPSHGTPSLHPTGWLRREESQEFIFSFSCSFSFFRLTPGGSGFFQKLGVKEGRQEAEGAPPSVSASVSASVSVGGYC